VSSWMRLTGAGDKVLGRLSFSASTFCSPPFTIFSLPNSIEASAMYSSYFRRRTFLLAFALLTAVAGSASSATAQTQAKAPPTIVFMTDFGTVDDSVAICRGVMYSIEPGLRIVDLTHQVTPFSILDGARFLF